MAQIEHVAQYLMTPIRATRLSASVFVEEAGNVDEAARDPVGRIEHGTLGRLRLHDLRHTASSQAVMAGENLSLVGKLFGHPRSLKK